MSGHFWFETSAITSPWLAMACPACGCELAAPVAPNVHCPACDRDLALASTGRTDAIARAVLPCVIGTLLAVLAATLGPTSLAILIGATAALLAGGFARARAGVPALRGVLRAEYERSVRTDLSRPALTWPRRRTSEPRLHPGMLLLGQRSPHHERTRAP